MFDMQLVKFDSIQLYNTIEINKFVWFLVFTLYSLSSLEKATELFPQDRHTITSFEDKEA